MEIQDEFLACVESGKEGDGWSFECKMGLWGVHAPTYLQAIKEAHHYWRQYKDDGEYHSIIGGKTPKEVLMEMRDR